MSKIIATTQKTQVSKIETKVPVMDSFNALFSEEIKNTSGKLYTPYLFAYYQDLKGVTNKTKIRDAQKKTLEKFYLKFFFEDGNKKLRTEQSQKDFINSDAGKERLKAFCQMYRAFYLVNDFSSASVFAQSTKEDNETAVWVSKLMNLLKSLNLEI
jgi:hypothetical protein